MINAISQPFVLLYILTVLVLNLGFSYVPMIPTEFGLISPMAVVAGAVFVMRDFAQRQAGHYVLVAMLIAAGLSFGLADPFVAVASVAAFASSEIIDWGIYTATKKPFHKRVLMSSLISTPIDTAVFLGMISGLTTGTFVLMIAAKLIAAVAIFYFYRAPTRDEQFI